METKMPESFYSSHSYYSHPGQYFKDLPAIGSTPKAIATWAAALLQHPRGPESKLKGFCAEQAADLDLRSVAEILSVARRRGLPQRCGSALKIGGVCRDFAIMAVSYFRTANTPARLRVGFADYIVPRHWEDHWICEWHDGCSWRRLDVEFTAGGDMAFDASNVPATRFVTAGEAWRVAADDPLKAQLFGVSSLGLSGEWFVAGSLFRDMAALRKLEVKPWDYWGLSASISRRSSEWPLHVKKTLDNLALQVTDADVQKFGAVAVLAQWPLPNQVIGYPRGQPMTAILQTEWR
jgi:hypothetical protein